MRDIAKFNDIENAIRQLPPIEYDLKHFQIPGIYVRSLGFKAGSVITGKIHKKQHISILAKGELALLQDGQAKRIQAPYIAIDEPGVKRVVYAVTDCTFINVIATEKTTIEEIEEDCVCETFEQFDDYQRTLTGEKTCHLQQSADS